MKVVIIGAGVAGLSIGWRLLQAGCAVTILERAQPAAGATWASAGMLAVTAELEDASEPERALALRAQAQWPSFAAELEAASGRGIFLNRVGALILAADGAELEVMRGRAGADLRILDRKEAHALVPLLGGAVGGLWSPHEAHVDNRALGEALTIAFLKAGGVLNAHEAAVAVDPGPVVLTPYGRHGADAVVIAAGAWSGLLGGIAVKPVKGEMIALSPPKEPPPDGLLPVPVVWGEGVYCVPRPHLGERGWLVVGATVQEDGFDTTLTREARDRLRAAAVRLMPSLKDWVLADHWAGLRPKSPDGLPLLGPSGMDGVFVAGGQYRNGILFAPAIARDMADMVQGKAAAIPDFDPRRFQ